MLRDPKNSCSIDIDPVERVVFKLRRHFRRDSLDRLPSVAEFRCDLTSSIRDFRRAALIEVFIRVFDSIHPGSCRQDHASAPLSRLRPRLLPPAPSHSNPRIPSANCHQHRAGCSRWVPDAPGLLSGMGWLSLQRSERRGESVNGESAGAKAALNAGMHALTSSGSAVDDG